MPSAAIGLCEVVAACAGTTSGDPEATSRIRQAMTAKIIDGKGIAADLRGKVADAVHRLARDRGIVPGLAVVLVGNNPASESYVASKMKMTVGSGMWAFHHPPPQGKGRTGVLGA